MYTRRSVLNKTLYGVCSTVLQRPLARTKALHVLMIILICSLYSYQLFSTLTLLQRLLLCPGDDGPKGAWGGASGLFELSDSSEDGERIGQRLDNQCY